MARTTSSGSGFVALCRPLLSESASKLGVAGLGIVNSPGKVLFSCGALEQALQEGSSAPQLCDRFNAPPPGSEAAHANAAGGAGVVGNSDEDSKSDRSPYQPSCTSIALGGRKFHVTSSDHCDLLAIAGGTVQVGLILAAVPFGTLVVLFRSPRLSAAPVRRVVRTFTDSLRGVALASA